MPSFRRVTFYVVLLILGYGLGLAAFPEAVGHGLVEASTNEMAPDLVLRKMDGKQVRLSDYRGRWVFLNFWATWCPPCIKEMPEMESFYKKFKNKNLAMIAVSVDKSDASKIAAFVHGHNLSFEIALDPGGESSDKFGVYSLPSTYIINPKGEVVSKALGGRDWADPEIVQYFLDLMKKN